MHPELSTSTAQRISKPDLEEGTSIAVLYSKVARTSNQTGGQDK